MALDSGGYVPEHFRNADPQLADLLDGGLVLMHPFVVGEIACGNLTNRTSVLDLLQQLPMEFAVEATKLLGLKLEGSVG